jgi:hypothetical protein
MKKRKQWAASFSSLTIFTILSIASLFAQAQSADANDTGGAGPAIYLIGSVHDLHFDDRYHYSLVDLAAQVRSLAPEVICGEITPEALGRAMEGNFPPEAAMLAVMARGWHSRFVAADWRVSFSQQRQGEQEEAADQSRAAAVEAEQERMKVFYASFAGVSLYDSTTGSAQFLAAVDHLFEEVVGEGTVSDLAAGAWHERNRRIVANCLTAAGRAKGIVFVFGAAHLPQLRRQLAERGMAAQIPARAFQPAGLGRRPPPVVARWERNLRNLEDVEKGSVAISTDQRRRCGTRIARRSCAAKLRSIRSGRVGADPLNATAGRVLCVARIIA